MLLLTCPCCGATAEETEFHAGGEAHIVRLAGAENTDEELGAYLFNRKNPKGVHFERWRHVYGCGKWFHVARDTRTLEVYGTYDIEASAPPVELQERIAQRLKETGMPEVSTS
ncbi:MAG: sarcosine oxidase subunit delta [Pseudomonadota bacterium]